MEFSFSISPSNEHSGLISFRMDWLDLLVIQGALNILIQHHSSKASILRHSAFFIQLSHPYMTTGKTIALTRLTFAGKVMSLLFNMLSAAAAAAAKLLQSCPTLCDPMNRSMPASLSITNSQSSPRLTSIESVMPSSHLILCRPLLLLAPIPPSIRVFSNESTLRMRWPKY